MALIGTPFGFSQAGSMVGHCDAGAVKRAFGCAAFAPVFLPISGVQGLPCQSIHSAGGSSVMPSHHTPPSGVSADIGEDRVLRERSHGVRIRLLGRSRSHTEEACLRIDGAKLPVGSGLIHAISSPTVLTFQPSIRRAESSWPNLSFRTRWEKQRDVSLFALRIFDADE